MTCLIEKKKKKKKRSILRLSNTSLCLCLAVAVLSSSILVVPFAMATVTSNVGGDADADDVDGDASRNSFVGKWKLKEIWDDSDDDKPRKLPTNDDGKPFILTFDEPSTRNKGGRSSDDNNDNDNDNNDNNNKSLNLYIKIGNSMRTSVKFLDDNADNDDSSSSSSSSSSKIEVGLVMGSRMYPGEELMGLENYLSAYLPQMKFIETKQSLLVMTTTTAATAETTNDGSGGGDGGGGGGVRQAKIICEAVEEESEA